MTLNRQEQFMDKQITFNVLQLKILAEAIAIAEDMVSNYYKMSSTQWIRSRYDIKTFRELKGNEIVEGPFAQVLGYDVRKKYRELGSSAMDYYIICFQDGAILDKIDKHKEIFLLPFLIYITVHELVHIVRFSKFEQIYSASSEVECATQEERRVHSITYEILRNVNITGMDKVLIYYKQWI